jgi:hypothetical protein
MSRTATLLLTAVTCFAAGAALALAADEKKAEPGKPVVLFNGKDVTSWKVKGKEGPMKWVVGYASMDEKSPNKLVVADKGTGEPQLINPLHSGDLHTEQKFGDGTFEVEFMIPKGSNSGVYVMGEYEVQILDSFGKEKVGPGDMGGLYGNFAPKVNACKKPGEWQKFVIEYQTPKFENGKKVSNVKFIKVVLNDQVIHENAELKGPTGGALTGKESESAPLMFQGDHGPVAFRNIKFTPKGK